MNFTDNLASLISEHNLQAAQIHYRCRQFQDSVFYSVYRQLTNSVPLCYGKQTINNPRSRMQEKGLFVFASAKQKSVKSNCALSEFGQIAFVMCVPHKNSTLLSFVCKCEIFLTWNYNVYRKESWKVDPSIKKYFQPAALENWRSTYFPHWNWLNDTNKSIALFYKKILSPDDNLVWMCFLLSLLLQKNMSHIFTTSNFFNIRD